MAGLGGGGGEGGVVVARIVPDVWCVPVGAGVGGQGRRVANLKV